MPNRTATFIYIFIGLLFISVGFLAFLVFYLFGKVNTFSVGSPTPTPAFIYAAPTLIPFVEATPLATTPAKTPAITVIPSATPSQFINKKTITYIPLGGSYDTQATNWVDVPNAQVTINISSDYGSLAKATWEAFLKIDQGNGIVYARLFDATHGTAVDGSEISTTDASFHLVGSGNLSLWAGNNLYKVQLKSLSGFTGFMDSGRIKISY